MADKKRLLDVWIVEINTVYREVPFAVVTDWLMQGRVLPEDRVRLAGGKTWHALDKVPVFAPYLPQPAPVAADDQAEALEPVDLGFDIPTRTEEEDEDVDMIPLIDISLVLLIFFMMTASISSGVFANINTPAARHKLDIIAEGSYWVGIEPKSRSGFMEKDERGKLLPWYSLGFDKKQLLAPTTEVATLLDTLAKQVENGAGEVRIRLRADRDLPIETIKSITNDLQNLEGRLNAKRQKKLALSVTGEVSEPEK
ncbi:MAG: biopolymer transporter ExbD [Planctomycetes bacterium]|nr:biopolymer transporter ExbD [Planctomycetota bacterium]